MSLMEKNEAAGRFTALADEGIPIVTPAHAIRQAHRAHLGPALLAQAIDDGLRDGRLTTRQAKELRQEIGVSASDGVRR